MKWLVLSWALSAGLVPYGFDRLCDESRPSIEVTPPYSALYVDIALKAELFDILKIWGNTECYATPIEGFMFTPYRQDYGIGIALYHGPFELGIKHECDHGVTTHTRKQWYEKGETQIYLMFSGKTEF